MFWDATWEQWVLLVFTGQVEEGYVKRDSLRMLSVPTASNSSNLVLVCSDHSVTLYLQDVMSVPNIQTIYELCRELSRKASRANNIWWRLSGLLGADNRVAMYAILQAIFTVLTMALTVPLFKHYRLHILFECFKVAASVWNGGIFFFDVMPKKMDAKKKRKLTQGKEAAVDPVSLNSTGLPIEGASIVDPPLSPGNPSPKLSRESSKSGDEFYCSLCKRPSTNNLDDVDAYEKLDGQLHVGNGRKLDSDLSVRGRLESDHLGKSGSISVTEFNSPQEPAAPFLSAAICAR